MLTTILFLLGLAPNPCDGGLFKATTQEWAPNIYIITGYECVSEVPSRPSSSRRGRSRR